MKAEMATNRDMGNLSLFTPLQVSIPFFMDTRWMGSHWRGKRAGSDKTKP